MNQNLDRSNNFSEIEEKAIPKGSDEMTDSQLDLSEQNDLYRTGRWQPSEHVRFIKGCLQYGNNWKKVRLNP